MDGDMRRIAIVALAVAALTAACTTTTVSQSDGSDTSHTRPSEPEDLLHERGAAATAVKDIVKAVGISPAQVTGVDIYDEYVIVEAQDPSQPDHIDSYTWRDGEVDPSTPVHLSGPQEDTLAELFPTSAFDFDKLSGLVRAAERLLRNADPTPIENGIAQYAFIERSSSLDGRLTLRVYIEGPRRSGNVEVTTSGEVVSQSVS
jgi:hypothetical protein